jgi:hypothetical protein
VPVAFAPSPQPGAEVIRIAEQSPARSAVLNDTGMSPGCVAARMPGG